MKTKTKILFNNFGRLEKVLFYNLFLDDQFEIVGIVSPANGEQIAYFLKQDTIHAKFLANKISHQSSKKSQKISFANEEQQTVEIFDPKNVDAKLIKKLNPDIIVDLSSDIKYNKLINLSKLAKYVLTPFSSEFKKKKDCEIHSYYLNHKDIKIVSEDENEIIFLPSIETNLITILAKILKTKIKIKNIKFNILKGFDNDSKILDILNPKNKKNLILNRSSFDNLIPYTDEGLKEEINILFNQENIDIAINGENIYVPIKTGALINLELNVENIYKSNEINEILIKELNSEIGISDDGLVSQDIVSTNYFGIIDKKLTKVYNTKHNPAVKLGIWFDFETSFALSCFKTIQYISGLMKK